MSPAISFGEYVADLRRNKGATQAFVAREIGVFPSHLSRIEASLVTPSDELLEKMADVLNVDPYLLYLHLGRVPLKVIAGMQANPKTTLVQWKKWSEQRAKL